MNYWSDYGAIAPSLWATMQAVEPTSKIPVGFILALLHQAPDKASASAAQIAADAATRAEKIAQVSAALKAATAKLGIADIRVVRGAPIAYADLTAEQIVALAKVPGVGRVVWAKPNLPQATQYVAAVGANSTGYTGVNKKVCVIEQYKYTTPSYVTFESTYCGTGSTTDHGRIVSGVINQSEAPYGTAPDSLLYYAHWDNCDSNAAPAMEWCIDQSAKVWNFSHTCSELDRWLFDYWTKISPYPLVVVAAGNEGPAEVACANSCGGSTIGTTSCGALNTLVVGGVNDCGTTSRSDDKIYCPTSSLNQGTDREFPHIAAPAQSITADGLTDSGTSFAAPNVSGIAAQLLEVNWNNIGNWPELSRAILIATADENVDGGRMTVLGSDIEHRDGAGEANALLATDLADSGNKKDGGNTACEKGFDMGTLTTSAPIEGNFYSEQYKLKTTQSGKKARIVVVWDGTATCSDPGAGSCSADSMDADIELEVTDGTVTYYSESIDNTYEFLEISLTANVEYTIKIRVYDWFGSQTYMAVAWYTAAFDS